MGTAGHSQSLTGAAQGIALRWLADENFNNDILRALYRSGAAIDVCRAQDAGLTGATDEALLEWAATSGQVVLTHDVTTMTAYAYDRASRGLRMPGVFEVRRGASLRSVIEDILLVNECSSEGEWEGQVWYLPLR